MTVLTNEHTNKHTNKLTNKHTNKQTQTNDTTDRNCTVSKSCVTVQTHTCDGISELLDNVIWTERPRVNNGEITGEAHQPETPGKNKEYFKNNCTVAMSEENFVTNLFSFLDSTVLESTQTDTETGEEIKSHDLYPFKQRNVSPSDSYSPPTSSPSPSLKLRSSPKPRALLACTTSHVMTETQIYEELYPEYDVSVEILYRTQCDIL